MEDEEKFKQFCDKCTEDIERVNYEIEMALRPFYEALRLSKKEYEERCRIENISKNKFND